MGKVVKGGIGGYSVSGVNPFRINAGFIRVFRVEEVDVDSGEVELVGKLGDMERHVRVYVGGVVDLGDMCVSGIRVLVYIMGVMRGDEVLLNVGSVVRDMGGISEVSVYRGVVELLRLGWIGRSDRRDVYWVNPSKFYCGSRVRWYRGVMGLK